MATPQPSIHRTRQNKNNNNMNGGQNNNEVMLGDLPLIRASHFQAMGNQYWIDLGFTGYSWDAPRNLERLQRILHNKRHGEEDMGEDEDSISLVSKYKPGIQKWYRNNKIPYHLDILPRWTAFADSHGIREGLDRIQIDNIVIPTAPFFEQKLLPILKNNNTSLTCLELHNCGLGADDISCIAQFIKKNKSLATLDISYNKINNLAAAKSLAKAMEKHSELCFVNLSKCGLGENVDILSAVLIGCKKLKSVLLDDNGINTEGALALLAKYVSSNKTTTVFSIADNCFGDTNAEILYKALDKNKRLREICLARNRISMSKFLLGSKHIAANLTHLDLTGAWYWPRSANDRIGVKGAKLIASFLERNPALMELNLFNNDINSSGGKKIASALKHNTNLQHLNLERNKLTNVCVPAFIDGLKNNTTLLSLQVGGNIIKVETGRKQLIRGALCDTTSLQTIADSNHTCALITSDGGKKYRNDITFEMEMKNINTVDESEGMKIRYKVVLAMFKLNQDLFHPRSFDDIPLELMPRLLELCQQELGFGGYGKGIVERTKKMDSKNTLRRLYQVFTEWNIPLLVMVSCF